jgi:hypothetical protein
MGALGSLCQPGALAGRPDRCARVEFPRADVKAECPGPEAGYPAPAVKRSQPVRAWSGGEVDLSAAVLRVAFGRRRR